MIIRHEFGTPTESPLVRAAPPVTAPSNDWQYDESVSGESTPCAPAVAFDLGCYVPYGINGKIVDHSTDPDQFIEFCRFNVVYSESCSVMVDNDWYSVAEYAEKGLLFKERRALESIVWGAENAPIDIDCALTNLVNPAEILNPGLDLCSIDAVTALEHVLYQFSDVVYIYVPRPLINYLVLYIKKDENDNFRTALGSYIIPGVGFDGSGPGGVPDAVGDSAFIYGSGPVKLLRGEVQTSRGVTEKQNKVEVIAERPWGVWFDPCPGVFGVSASYLHV
jgi:hypothetical protein